MIKPIVSMIMLVVFALSLAQSVQAQTPNGCPFTIACHDLNTSFMPGACMVEVWAKDFIKKIDNDSLTFDQNYDVSFSEDSLVMSKVYFSEQGHDFIVKVWIKSKSTSCQTYCEVVLRINENTGECPEICIFQPSPWCGYAVVTCSAPGNNDPVAAIIDTRKNSKAPRGDDWSRPRQSGKDTVKFLRPPSWTKAGIGMVFGTALNPLNGDIYLAASDVYAFDFKEFTATVGFPPPTCVGPAGAAGIYLTNFGSINTTSTLVSTLSNYPATLAQFNATVIGSSQIPNTGNQINCNPTTIADRDTLGNGLGNIAFDKRSKHLFASNMEDGKIYSINVATKKITAVFDPFSPYVHVKGIVKLSERIWGIQVNDCSSKSKVFFARASTDTATFVKNKIIYSIEIDAFGKFVGTEQVEVVVDKGRQHKFTDIAFSQDCRKMLLSERGHQHKSAVFEYAHNGTTWQFVRQYFVGINDPNDPGQPDGNILGTSSAGGVSYGSKESNCVVDSQCDSLVWATMNCGDIISDNGRCAIYGAEGISAAGNQLSTNNATDIFVNFNPTFNGTPVLFKGGIGDIEIFNCCCPSNEGRDTVRNTVMIAGAINAYNNIALPKAQVNLQESNTSSKILTDIEGHYAFEGLEMYKDYMIQPSMAGDLRDGISTLDLLLLQRHILGISKFKEAYQYLAGDVNNSGTISSADLVELRKVILGVYESFPNNNVWNFVNRAHLNENVKLKDINYIALSGLDHNVMGNNFIGIKTGDINGDNSLYKSASIRGERSIHLAYELIYDPVKSKYRLLVYSPTAQLISGIQLELQASKNVLNKTIEGRKLALGNENVSLVNNNIRLSWNNINSVFIAENDVLFSVDISGDPGKFSLNYSGLYPESYGPNGEVYAIKWTHINDKVEESGIVVYPNPMAEKLNFEFLLNEATNVRLQVFSTDGKLVYLKENSFQKGNNRMTIERTEFGSVQESGLYFYQMSIGEKSYTGKIALVKR